MHKKIVKFKKVKNKMYKIIVIVKILRFIYSIHENDVD